MKINECKFVVDDRYRIAWGKRNPGGKGNETETRPEILGKYERTSKSSIEKENDERGRELKLLFNCWCKWSVWLFIRKIVVLLSLELFMDCVIIIIGQRNIEIIDEITFSCA